VPECQSPVFGAVDVDRGGIVHLYFDAPPEAPATRGFAGILHAGLGGLRSGEALATPGDSPASPRVELVRPLRLRGMAAMLARIKCQVRERAA
jgi:cysteine desulfuration protein SufE